MQTIKEISNRLSGVFNPIRPSNNPILADIYSSLHDMQYYGVKNDKGNIRSDIENLGNDFKKSTKEASKKVNHGETSSTK